MTFTHKSTVVKRLLIALRHVTQYLFFWHTARPLLVHPNLLVNLSTKNIDVWLHLVRVIQSAEVLEAKLDARFNIVVSHLVWLLSITFLVGSGDILDSHVAPPRNDLVLGLCQEPFVVDSAVLIEHALLAIC